MALEISEKYVSGSQNNVSQQVSTDHNATLYEQLRNEWKIGSKCIVFSSDFQHWIYTNIIEIKNEKREQILTVKNGNCTDEDESDSDHSDDSVNEAEPISLERFSN
eukprot:103604_1